MTIEEKQMLLKDICARVPYGVKCNALLKQIDGSLKNVFGTFKGYNGWATVGNNLVDIETVKPYLRQMSSMTEEEEKEYYAMCVLISNGGYDWYYEPTLKSLDWLNAHYFDYRGLIEKGLAIEAPKGMY